MQHFGIISNPHKEKSVEVSQQVINWLLERGKSVYIDSYTNNIIPQNDYPAMLDNMDKLDAIILLGGDGTILHTAQHYDYISCPIASINLGTLGFLTTTTRKNTELLLESLLNGNYHLSQHHLLRVKLSSQERSYLALNEVVLSRYNSSRMVSIHAYADGKEINYYQADGLIIATPTGSTAYSLSAGGPLVHPEINGFVVTPICSYTLSDSSIIIPDNKTITLKAEAKSDDVLKVAIDGQQLMDFNGDDTLSISKSEQIITIIRLPDYDHYDVLRRKLNWRGNSTQEYIES